MFSKPVPWKWSLLVAAIATYAPYVLLCLLMLYSGEQSGNTWTAFWLLPYAPGVVPAILIEGTLRTFGITTPHVGGVAGWIFPVFSAATFIVAVASLGRLGREWLVGGAVTAFFIHGIAAYGLLLMIRM